MIHTFLLVAAVVLAIVAAFWNPPRVALGWLAIACIALSMMPGLPA